MNITTDEFDEIDVEFDVAKLSEIADHHVAVMDGMTPREADAFVRDAVAASEFVFAVWRTRARSGRTGLLCIKGVGRLIQDRCSGVATEEITTAIPSTESQTSTRTETATRRPARFVNTAARSLFRPDRSISRKVTCGPYRRFGIAFRSRSSTHAQRNRNPKET